MQGFKFTWRIPVVWRDMDALGHVNNAVYLTYLETARIAYFTAVTGADWRKVDFILAEATVTYKSPAVLGETLVVGVRVPEIGHRSFPMEYRIEEEKTGRLVATARTIQVSYDYETGRSKPVTEWLRKKLEAYEGLA